MCSPFFIHSIYTQIKMLTVFNTHGKWVSFQISLYFKVACHDYYISDLKKSSLLFSLPHFSELFSFPFFPLLLSLGSVWVCMCVPSDCLPPTNWSVFLSIEWQVPVYLTIARQTTPHPNHLPPNMHTQCHTYHTARWACVPHRQTN